MELKQSEKTKGKRGGARPNSGRKKGSVDKVTIAGLLEAVQTTSGQDYMQILAEDFNKARLNNDSHLTMKYHNLILSKVMASLNHVEVTEPEDAVEAKKVAFADALKAIAGVKK